jgi:hypothetical protein
MMNGTTVESLGRVYTKLAAAVPVVTVNEQVGDVVGALLLVTILIEKQRSWADQKIGHKQAFMALVEKLYDQTSASGVYEIEEGLSHGSV